jgi:nucleoporin SEH1
VKWNGPFIGEVIGSIGEDGRFKLWEEDVTEMPGSMRRFRCISSLQSETKVPFMSLDFKNILTETYAALITRDGYLSIYEPVDHDDLSMWKSMTSRYICPTPPRQEETGFKVCFHKEKLPCWTMIQAGLERNALSLAVAAMNVVKILRTDQNRNFYQAAELSGARNIIRDVAWANGSMRGFDIIATASKDGAVRIYELHPPEQKSLPEARQSATAENSARAEEKRNAPSGIGAGLANTAASLQRTRDDERNPGLVRNVVKKVAELNSHQGAVWRVAFSQIGKSPTDIVNESAAHMIGDLLVSTGDDGVVRTWKKSTHNDWLEYAQIDVEEPDM